MAFASDKPEQIAPLSAKAKARFETARRLIACLVNEHLVASTLSKKNHKHLVLTLRKLSSPSSPPSSSLTNTVNQTADAPSPRDEIKVTLRRPPVSNDDGDVGYLDPEDISPPIHIHTDNHTTEEYDPSILFTHAARWFVDETDAAAVEAVGKIVAELASSATNFEYCCKYLTSVGGRAPPTLTSSAATWERAVVAGHPTHPMHRSCVAEAPLEAISATRIPDLFFPTLSLVAVPREDVRVTGPFEETIRGLLPEKYRDRGEREDDGDDDVIFVPCLSRQLPSVAMRFPRARVVERDFASSEAQASLRTVKPSKPISSTMMTTRSSAELKKKDDPAAFDDEFFPYHLKLPLAARITSALRTITPWTACLGPQLSDYLVEIFPEELWLAREVASVVGAQEDFDQAKHLACVVREDLEARANDRDEAIIVAGALAERWYGDNDYRDDEERGGEDEEHARDVYDEEVYDDDDGDDYDVDVDENEADEEEEEEKDDDDDDKAPCHAERIFHLNTRKRRLAFLRRYASLLFSLTLPLLRDHGVALESHGQNTLVRVRRSTRSLVGFVARDCGGVKIHRPTFDAAVALRHHHHHHHHHHHGPPSSPPPSLPPLDVLPGSLAFTDDLEECYALAFHTLVHSQLHRLVRALRLLGNPPRVAGKGETRRGRRTGEGGVGGGGGGSCGWRVVRRELRKVCPEGDPVGDFFRRVRVPMKCFVRMKLDGLYRDYIHRDIPNIMLT